MKDINGKIIRIAADVDIYKNDTLTYTGYVLDIFEETNEVECQLSSGQTKIFKNNQVEMNLP